MWKGLLVVINPQEKVLKGFSVFEFFVSFFSTSGNFTDLILSRYCFKAKKSLNNG